MLIPTLLVIVALGLAFVAAKSRARRWKRALLFVLAASVLLAGLLLSTFVASPLPAPAPFAGSMPTASPPSDMAIFYLPTGVTHRSAAFAYRGGSFFDKRDFSMAAALVRHPRGDVLIDTGFGRDVDAHFKSMPFFFRAVTSYAKGVPAADQLDAAGYDRKKLRGILLTHAHWDHVSGVPDFSGTPVLVNAVERKFIDEGGFLTVVARAGKDAGARFEEYEFRGGPYLGFPSSHDLYGDGSIVVVPAPGHTPGSVIVFVTLPAIGASSGTRYAFVGDLAWQTEGITEREERPWLQRTLGDVDPPAVRDALLQMDAIALQFPEMILVPAHDARAFARMPKW